MRFVLGVAAAALLVVTAGCAASPDGFFSGPRVIQAQGSFNLTKVQTVFVHEGQTAYAHWRSRVIAYGGITYADRGASVHGFDEAVIYYHKGALVETYGNAKAFFCPGPDNAPFDRSTCIPR